MDEIKRIKREHIYKGRVIDCFADTMQIEGGKTVIWDYIHHNGAAAVVPVTAEGKIVMVSQYRNTVERMTWEIPAGKRESDEDTSVCAARELEEETGYRAARVTPLLRFVATIAYCDELIDIYLAEDLTFCGQDLDEDEFINVREFTVEELKAMIFSQKIVDGKTIAGVMAYIVKAGL